MDNVGHIRTHQVTIVELATKNESQIEVQSGEDLSTGAFLIWGSLNGQEIKTTRDKYFVAFQDFRDKLLEAGYGMKCNGARLDVAPMSRFETGSKVYVLESEKKKQPENTVDIWDKADINDFPDSRQQNRFKNKWYDEHIGPPERSRELSKLCLAGFIFTLMPPVYIVLVVLFQSLYLVWIVCALLSPLLGLVFCIAGLATAGRSGKKGIGFGVAGIAIQCVSLVVAVSILGPILAEHSKNNREITNNEMYHLHSLGDTKNTDYDISRYMIPEGYDFKSLNITVSDTEFEAYAEDKLQTISNKTDKSIRGEFQGYGFLIVRSDCFDEWLSVNRPEGIYYDRGYARIMHLDWWEFAAISSVPLAVYKDPSDKFIIITNCGDYKVIAEFFEGIGEAKPIETTVEETIEETNSPEFYENNELVVYLKDNINEDMSLLEIINVFDESCKDTRKTDMFNLEFGPYNYSTYDPYTGEFVEQGEYYCFSMTRWFLYEDGKFYVLCVSVLYEINDENKDFKHVTMTDYNIDGDFFEYARKSYPYNYASTEKIAGIDIYMRPV